MHRDPDDRSEHSPLSAPSSGFLLLARRAAEIHSLGSSRYRSFDARSGHDGIADVLDSFQEGSLPSLFFKLCFSSLLDLLGGHASVVPDYSLEHCL